MASDNEKDTSLESKRKLDVLSSGLDLDSSKKDIKVGDFSFALNSIIQSERGDSIQNEESNILCQSLPENKQSLKLIGSINIDESTVVFLTDNTSSEIGIFDKFCTYTTIVNNPCLNFHLENQVKGVYRPNNLKCGRTIYWTDNFRNPMRWLDIDNVPTPNDSTLCDKIRIFPEVGDPCVQLVSVDETGSLHSGVYQVAIQYADIDGNPLTGFYGLTDIISIYGGILANWATIQGDPADTLTNKSINITVSNLNTNFQSYNIGIIQTIGGVSTTYIVATLPTSQANYIITGSEERIPITLADFIAKPVIYTGAKEVTQTIRRLIWGNLKGRTDYNFQPYANNIKVRWQEYKIKSDNLSKDYKNPLSSAYRKSFLRDEVVPMGIVLKYADGSESCTYHIPGRTMDKDSFNQDLPLLPTQDPYGAYTIPIGRWDSDNNPADITNADNYDNQFHRWQVYNTAYNVGNDILDGNGEGWWKYGEMAYYETANGTYPNIPEVWGSLAGQPIRHNKFPDCTIAPIIDASTDNANGVGEYSTQVSGAQTDFNEQTYINLLGIRLYNIQALIQQAITDGNLPNDVVGWDVVRADRTFEKTIIAKGLLYNGRLYQQIDSATGNFDGIDKIFPNYPYNSLKYDNLYNDIDLANQYNSNHFSKREFTFESPSTSFKTIGLSASELKIEVDNFGPCFVKWEEIKDGEIVSNNNDIDNPALVSIGVGKYNKSIIATKTSVRRKLTECTYINANSFTPNPVLKTIQNTHGASLVYLGVDAVDIANPPKVEGDNRLSASGVIAAWSSEPLQPYSTRISSYYCSLKNNNRSVFSNLESITYINIPKECDIADNDPIRLLGGDTYITFYATKRKHGFFTNYSNGSSKSYNYCSGNWLIDYPATYVTITSNNIKPQLLGSKYDTCFGGSTYYKSVMDHVEASGVGYGYYIIDPDNAQPAGDAYYNLFVTGVPGFWVESEINTELRYDTNTLDTEFYPRVDTSGISFGNYTSISNWLNRSASNDPVAGGDMGYFNENSTWLYNFDYSTQNDKHQFCIYPLSTTFEDLCTTTYPQREIWSEAANNEQVFDAYLQYLPTSYFDYPKEDGAIWSIFATQGILFTRMVNGIYKLQLAPQELETSTNTITIGVPALFSVPPVKLEEVDNGYGGTQSQWALNITPFGAFFADQNTGKVFNLSAQLNEISANKCFFYFRDNLKPDLKNQVDSILGINTFQNYDNPANPYGTGLLSVWDNKYNRWILTKKDYLLKNPELLSNGTIIFENGKFLLNRQVLELSNTDYFCNQSFTMSYYPVTQRWISFHSYIPSSYITQKNDFFSWLSTPTNLGGYKHNNECLYQTYYDQGKAFIVEIPTILDQVDTYTEPCLSWTQQTFQCQTGGFVADVPVTFNKAYVYNDNQSSGNLNLKTVDLNDLTQVLSLPVTNISSTDVEVVKREKTYSFSDFWDRTNQLVTLPLNTSDCSNLDYIQAYPIDQVVNNAAIDYNTEWYDLTRFRDKYNTFRFILDNNFNTKLVCNFFINYPKYSF